MIFLVSLLGAILGLALAFGLATLITVSAMKKSNDVGDSQGTLKDFNGYLDVICSEDGLNKMMG